MFQLSQIYNKPINDLLQQQIPSEPLIVQFRAARRFEAKLDKEVAQKINDFQDLCSDYVHLEQLLGNKLPPSQAPIYALDTDDPEKSAEDPDQGNVLFTKISLNKVTPERLAEEAAIAERNRLGLGDAPIYNLRELLEAEGLRIFQMKLPRQILGNKSLAVVQLPNSAGMRSLSFTWSAWAGFGPPVPRIAQKLP